VQLPLTVTTSSRRYEGRILRTVAGWGAINLLFELGVPASTLARLYAPPRSTAAATAARPQRTGWRDA
jgi:hypothetical protein